jgi:hypothetical protein
MSRRRDQERTAGDPAPMRLDRAMPIAAPAATAHSPQQVLALQRTAGNQAVAGMLAGPREAVARSTAAPTAPPGERVAAMLADGDGTAIRDISDEEIAAATTQQRAGLIRIVSDLTWTSYAEELATVRILRHGGANAEVTAALDVLGYRQQVLDSVDDAALHAELEQLLGAAPAAAADGPIAAALSSRSADDVIAIADFSEATPAQRLGLLQILLDLSWSTAVEEAKMLDILASAGSDLGGLVADLTAAGLKQALFDHVDDGECAQRLSTMLRALGDPELDRDLDVFEQGLLGAIGSTLLAGAVSAAENFSPGDLIMGLLNPFLHPIDTYLGLCGQLLDIVKDPSLDRVLTFCRDVTGMAALYLSPLALGFSGVAAALGAASAFPPLVAAAAPVGAIAAAFTGAMLANAIGFGVFALFKLAVDVVEGSRATTAHEREHEVREVGEDLTLLAVIGIFAGMVRGLKALFERVRGAATDAKQADPKALEQTGDQARKSEQDAAKAAEDMKSESGKRTTTTPAGQTEAATARRRLTVADIRRMKAQGIKVLTFRCPSEDVVANKTITAQHRTNPMAPEDTIFFGEGYQGFNYGRYAMIVEFDLVENLRPNGNSPGEYLARTEIPTSQGYWAVIEDIMEALGKPPGSPD